jgi:hypothetical protein
LLCGNGVVDMCTVTGCQGNMFEVPEACDGAVAAGTTCASLGYQDGQLACGSWCGFDTSGCTMCSGDAHVAACQERVPNHPGLVLTDIATSGSRVALIADGDQSHLVIASADLSTVVRERCFTNRLLSVVHTPNGWLIQTASGTSSTTSIRVITPLDEDGNNRGGAWVVPGHFMTTLVQGSDDGPLLVGVRDGSYDNITGLRAIDAVKLDNLSNVLWTTHVFDDDLAEPASVVPTDSGYLIAGRIGNVAKVGPAGVLESIHSYPFFEMARLGWTGTEGRLSWIDVNLPGVYLARLDGSGAPIGSPVVVAQGLAGQNQATLGAEMVNWGPGTLLLLPGLPIPGASPALAGLIVDGDLNVTVPLFPIARSPVVSGSAIKAMGTDAIVAWSGYSNSYGMYSTFAGWMGLARLTP